MSTLAPFHALFTPQGLSTGVGFAASSFFFWGNVALARMGAIHLIKPTSAKRLRITPVQTLALWETNLDLATAHFLPTDIVAALALGTAGWLSGPRPPVRSLLWLASGVHALLLAYTVVIIAPINHRLKEILHHVQSRASGPSEASQFVDKSEELAANEGIARWRTVNTTRFTMAGAAWVTAMLALLVHDP